MYTIAKSKGSNKYVVYLAGETKVIPYVTRWTRRKLYTSPLSVRA
jgi:hypothetical protein